jgi:hypothetical protein
MQAVIFHWFKVLLQNKENFVESLLPKLDEFDKKSQSIFKLGFDIEF